MLFVSTSYPLDLNDWKGLFIRHLADALARHGQISLQLWAPPGDAHPGAVRVSSSSDDRFLSGLMRQGGIAHLLRHGGLKALTTSAQLLWRLRRAGGRDCPDIYHVNWLQNALTLRDDGKPLLVSALGSDMQLVDKPLVRGLLRRVFSRHSTVICPNAAWMVTPLTHAFGECARIAFTPFGIDPIWYAIDRQRSMQANGARRWLVVSRLTPAKLGPLLEWGKALFKDTPRELHLFGPMQEILQLPDWLHYHGPASPAELCHDQFPSAQGLISLSRHAEGRPQVMLEAMAAGLPVVASRLPAHENIIQHRRTGWLCDNASDVAEALNHFECIDANLVAGRAARDWVSREIGSWDDCAERYNKHYDSLLGNRPHG